MKLDISFDELFKAARKMGAKPVEFDLAIEHIEIDPVDSELATGKEIELKDIEFIDGFPSYEGRQVLIYIKDHSYRDKIDQTLRDGKEGNKFHVADCSTIVSYRESSTKRFDRYVITTNLSGDFPIAGTNQYTGEYKEGSTQLCVCKNCLKFLNYKNYKNNPSSAFNHFKLAEFFSTYSSFFAYLPNRTATGSQKEAYTDDWGIVSGQYKADKQFCCEQCGVNLSSYKNLLHVHHKNGVKGDNTLENLIALCADCHRKEPYHEHLFIPQKDTALINHLRKSQALFKTNDWQEVYEFADPAMYGLIAMCEKAQTAIPAVAYELIGNNDQIVAEFELAWPRRKQCIVIRSNDAKSAKLYQWRAWSMIEAIENFSDFKDYIS